MKSFVFCLWVETGLAELLCIFSGLCAFGCHMGERKQPYKYLSKVYICTGIFGALLHFSGKTITRQTGCYHYKHLCKVHISNGNFNLGMNVQEAVFRNQKRKSLPAPHLLTKNRNTTTLRLEMYVL